MFVIKINEKEFGLSRDEVYLKLLEKGIQTNVHYMPLHKMSYFKRWQKINICSNADYVHSKLLSLPIYPSLKNKEIKYIIDSICELSRR